MILLTGKALPIVSLDRRAQLDSALETHPDAKGMAGRSMVIESAVWRDLLRNEVEAIAYQFQSSLFG